MAKEQLAGPEKRVALEDIHTELLEELLAGVEGGLGVGQEVDQDRPRAHPDDVVKHLVDGLAGLLLQLSQDLDGDDSSVR